MVQLVLRLAVYGSAVAAGFGIISNFWLAGTIGSAYLLSILDESKSVSGGDFRNLEESQFMASDTNIKKRLGIRLVYAGILFCLCLGISQFLI